MHHNLWSINALSVLQNFASCDGVEDVVASEEHSGFECTKDKEFHNDMCNTAELSELKCYRCIVMRILLIHSIRHCTSGATLTFVTKINRNLTKERVWTSSAEDVQRMQVVLFQELQCTSG
jgi:hypothetical protein